MRTIAYLVSAGANPVGTQTSEYTREVGLQFEALRAPCRARGLDLQPVVWDAPDTDWSRFDAAMVATTWDYWTKTDAFLATLDRVGAAMPLYNSSAIVRWNIDKGYLAQLSERGVPSVPTLWRDRADMAELDRYFAELNADEIVIKPRVGAGAWRQARIRRGGTPPSPEELPPAACLIQPFLPSVVSEGELTLMVYGGELSHALRKIPKSGDYRVQAEYGGREVVHEPTPEELACAKAAVARATEVTGEPLLYARVDIVRDLQNAPVLIELELVEPYHYPEQGPGCGERFAHAFVNMLDQA